jgi:hypothetical protein
MVNTKWGDYDSDDEPFIDFIDGVFYQTHSFEEFLSYFAQNYYTSLPKRVRKDVNKEQFVERFSEAIIRDDIRYIPEVKEMLDKTLSMMLLESIC